MKTRLLLITFFALGTAIAMGNSINKKTHSKLAEKYQLYKLQSKIKQLNAFNKSQSVTSASFLMLDSLNSYYKNESSWEASSKSYFLYNDNGTMQEQIHLYQNYDFETEAQYFMEEYKISFAYNSNNRITQEIYANKDTTAWLTSEITNYSYDNQGRITNISYLWDDEEKGNFEESARATITYGNNEKTMMFQYKDDQGNFVTEEKVIIRHTNNIPNTTLYYDTSDNGTLALEDSGAHTANTLGQIIEEKWYSIENESNTTGLALVSKYEYSYDNNGNPTLEKGFNLNNTQEWIATEAYQYDYDLEQTYADNYYNLPLSFMYMEYPETISNIPLVFQSGTDDNGSGIVMDYKEEFIYSETSTALKKLNDKHIIIYPNPASNYIVIKNIESNQQFNLYDLKGRLAISKTINNNDRITTTSIDKGIYVYTIQNESDLHKGHIIIK